MWAYGEKYALFDAFAYSNISKYFLFVLYLKRRNNWPPGVSALDALNDYTWQRRLAEKMSFKVMYIKQITNIMKY